jgi:hypothetical protein
MLSGASVFPMFRKYLFYDMSSSIRVSPLFWTDHGFLTYAACKGKILEDDYSVFFWMLPRPYESSLILQGKRVSKMENNTNPFYYFFCIVSEQYKIAKEMQKLQGCPENFAYKILNHSIKNWFYENDIDDFIALDGLDVTPGNESIRNEVFDAILKYRKKLSVQKNQDFVAPPRKKNIFIKLVKCLLPYGLIRIWQKLKY